MKKEVSKEAVVKTPAQFQLQKLNFLALQQFKNIEIQYHLLRMLDHILSTDQELVCTAGFAKVFVEFMNFEQFQSVRMLSLFEKFSYRLWNNENFSLELRQKTSFYRIISNWIVNFELRSGKLDTVQSQFALVLSFMKNQTKTMLERLVMIEEIFEDLQELISDCFWKEEKIIKIEASSFGKFKNQMAGSESAPNKERVMTETELAQVKTVLGLIEAILNPAFYRLSPNNKLYRNCTYGSIRFANVITFLKKCIYYILSFEGLASHLQTELTKISLLYLQFLTLEQSQDILNMIKHLMLRTSKAVRFALVVQYVEFYEYLELMGFQEVIEELESMIYFRELIIGKKIVEESIMEIGNNLNDATFSHQQLYIKAGTNKKVYFSNQLEQCVLKLDLIVEQNDINIKVSLFDNIIVDNKPKGLNQFLFETVSKINDYDGTKTKPQRVYWQQERSTSKKLQLKLQYIGLYCLQFDNSYSWVIPKNIKYRMELYQPLK